MAIATLAFSRFISPSVLNSIINKTVTDFLFLPTYYVVALIFGTFFVGSMLSVINVKAKKITFGDMFNVTCFFYSLLSLFLFIGLNNNVYTLFFTCGAFCHLVVLIARIKQYVYARNKEDNA
jgi:uncharacterized membrane protein YiaA